MCKYIHISNKEDSTGQHLKMFSFIAFACICCDNYVCRRPRDAPTKIAVPLMLAVHSTGQLVIDLASTFQSVPVELERKGQSLYDILKCVCHSALNCGQNIFFSKFDSHGNK